MIRYRHRVVAIGLSAALGGCVIGEAPSGFSILQEGSGMQHAAPQPANSLLGRLSVDGTPNGMMRPGQRALWDFSFTDGRTGSSISRFDIHHDKAMHLIMVHRDLASFAHLHPSLEADGRFRLPINAPNDDPDNRDAVSAVSRPGTYFLFGEVVPNGQSMTLARFTVQVQGTEQLEPLTADPVSSSGEIQRYASPDRPAGQVGDPYQVTLRMARGEHHAGMPMVTFNFTVRERGPQGRYAEVRNLETWLGMPGHAVLIGRQGERVEDRVFRHLHAASHEAGAQGRHTMQANGPQLSFMAMGDDVPPTGLYRLWCQFKHRGRVVTTHMTLSL